MLRSSLFAYFKLLILYDEVPRKPKSIMSQFFPQENIMFVFNLFIFSAGRFNSRDSGLSLCSDEPSPNTLSTSSSSLSSPSNTTAAAAAHSDSTVAASASAASSPSSRQQRHPAHHVMQRSLSSNAVESLSRRKGGAGGGDVASVSASSAGVRARPCKY